MFYLFCFTVKSLLDARIQFDALARKLDKRKTPDTIEKQDEDCMMEYFPANPPHTPVIIIFLSWNKTLDQS